MSESANQENHLENDPNISTKSRCNAVLLCSVGGIIGLHRFYLGLKTSAVMQILFGWSTLYIWNLVDLIKLLFGAFKDANGKIVKDLPYSQEDFTENNANISKKDRVTALFLCYALGTFGAHRFYLGLKKLAIIQLLAFGLSYLLSNILLYSMQSFEGSKIFAWIIWLLSDLLEILRGKFKDVDGKFVKDLPEPQENLTETSDNISEKNRLMAFILCYRLGFVGAHRFYLGLEKSAIVQIPFGWLTFGIWPLVDAIRILRGTFKDADGKVVKNWKLLD